MKKVKDLREALAFTTKAYMKSAIKEYERNIIENAILMTKLSLGNMKPYLEVESLFENEFGDYGRNKAGLVRLNYYKITEEIKNTLQKKLGADVEPFLKEVLELSNKYVPIDKRYIKKKNISRLNSSVRRRILRLDSDYAQKQYFKYADFENDQRYSQNALYEEGFEFSRLTRKRGWYESSEVEFVNNMLRSSNNRRKTISRVFWNGKTLQKRGKRTENLFDTGFKLRKRPLSFAKTYEEAVDELHKKGIKVTSKQPTGGYQELKKSGKIVGLENKDLNKWKITYSAYDKSRKFSTFNYAALQHENLVFKHARGKKPLFLKKALDKVIATYRGGNK